MRKDQATLTAAEKAAFVNAVLALKQEPSVLHPDDRTLSRYDDFVEVHLNAMMVMMNNQPSWAHQGPVFGPWHRVLLRQFELELQKIDSQVEIPYWDWTRAATPDPGPHPSGKMISWDRTGARPGHKSARS